MAGEKSGREEWSVLGWEERKKVHRWHPWKKGSEGSTRMEKRVLVGCRQQLHSGWGGNSDFTRVRSPGLWGGTGQKTLKEVLSQDRHSKVFGLAE